KRSNESGYSGWIVGNPEVGIPELVTSGLPVTRQQHGINPITEQSVIVRQNRNLIGADTHSFNLSSSSKKHRTPWSGRFCVGDGGGNGEFGLGPGIEFAPDSQLTAHTSSALVHAG